MTARSLSLRLPGSLNWGWTFQTTGGTLVWRKLTEACFTLIKPEVLLLKFNSVSQHHQQLRQMSIFILQSNPHVRRHPAFRTTYSTLCQKHFLLPQASLLIQPCLGFQRVSTETLHNKLMYCFHLLTSKTPSSSSLEVCSSSLQHSAAQWYHVLPQAKED